MGRRAATDRTTPVKHSTNDKENEEQAALLAEVQQWRTHGKMLSDVMRQLQEELEDERAASERKDLLLRAQEEKIRLLENMLLQAGAAGSPQRRQQPPPQELPKWLPKWPLFGDNNGSSERRDGGSPPPWSMPR